MLEVLVNTNLKGSRRERKKIEFKNKIILAALKLFSSNGYDNTSIVEIMRIADLGVGTFYNYFSSKDDILVYLFEELNKRLEYTIMQNIDSISNPIEQITTAYEVLARELEKDKGFAKVVYLELLRHPMVFDIMPHRQQWLVNLFDNVIKSGQVNNEFRVDISSEKTARLLLGMSNQAVCLWVSNDKETLLDILEFNVDIILKGIKNNI